ncbi:uncharacterized protein BKA78DRAFT_298520 [Phyllosticta capitalensis]|uniref:uncharacterized protein n=1 Tax=Phyllosticta capitalensis TaxID=121624 RepID=UPI00312FBE1D
MVSPTTSLSSSGRPPASASTCCDSVPLSNHCPTGGSVRRRPSRQSRGPPSSGAAGFSRAEVPPGDERSVLLRRGRTQQQEQGHQPPLPCPLLPPRPLLPPPAGVRTVSRALADPDWRDRRPRGDREGQLPLAPGVTAAAPQWRARVGMPMPLPPPAPWTAPQGAPAGLITPPSSASSAFSYSPSLHGGPSPSPDGAFFQYVTPRFRQHGLTPPPGLELSRGRYPIAEYFEGAEMAFPPPGSALHRRGPTESTTQHRCRWTARHERTLRDLRRRLQNLQLLRREALEEERLRRRRHRHQHGLRPAPRGVRGEEFVDAFAGRVRALAFEGFGAGGGAFVALGAVFWLRQGSRSRSSFAGVGGVVVEDVDAVGRGLGDVDGRQGRPNVGVPCGSGSRISMVVAVPFFALDIGGDEKEDGVGVRAAETANRRRYSSWTRIGWTWERLVSGLGKGTDPRTTYFIVQGERTSFSHSGSQKPAGTLQQAHGRTSQQVNVHCHGMQTQTHCRSTQGNVVNEVRLCASEGNSRGCRVHPPPTSAI